MTNNGQPIKKIGYLILGVGVIAAILIILLIQVSPLLAKKLTPEKIFPPNNTPLIVTVMYPTTGQVLQPGESVQVLVDAAGANNLKKFLMTISGPVANEVEIDLDGTQDAIRTTIPLNAPSTPGVYSMSVMVYDNQGYSEVSNMINISVGSDAQKPQLYEEIPVATWEEVEQKAEEHQVPVEAIVAVNPQLIPPDGVFGQTPIEPTTINLPVAPTTPLENQENPPDIPPAPPEDTGSLDDVLTGSQILLNSLNSDLNPPAAPEILTIELKGCEATLVFSSTNQSDSPEATGYSIYRSSGGDFHRMETIRGQSGQIKYLDAELPPGNISYIVSAFNAAGEVKSKSKSVSVTTKSCMNFSKENNSRFWEKPTFTVPKNITQFYCYVSILNSPWLRIPQDPGFFLYPDTSGKFIEPIGAHQSVMPEAVIYNSTKTDLSGNQGKPFVLDCWGWSGDSLVEMGRVEGEFVKERDGFWNINASNDAFSFTGGIVGGFQGSQEKQDIDVQPPSKIQVIGDTSDCVDHLKKKYPYSLLGKFLKPEKLCKAIYKSNLLVNWEKAEGGGPEPDGYELYQFNGLFKKDVKIRTIQSSLKSIALPRESIKRCYYMKTVYTDVAGFTHRSRRSDTFCIPPIPTTVKQNSEMKSESLPQKYTYSMHLESYKYDGKQKVGSGPQTIIDCSKTSYTAVPEDHHIRKRSEVRMQQYICYGNRYTAFATFDLSKLAGKQIQSARVHFTLGDHKNTYPNHHNTSCAQNVALINTHDPYWGSTDTIKEWGIPYLEDVPSEFGYDVTDAVFQIASGKGENETNFLVIGITPDEFVSKELRNNGPAFCHAEYENFILDVTYYDN